MNTTACNDIADYVWLTGDEASALLAELAKDDSPLHTAITRLRGKVSAHRAHLLVEQVDLRRRAAAKFTQAHRMFFTRTGLEQATDEWIAAYKASRIREQVGLSASNGSTKVVDLCCGIGGDLMALAKQSATIAADLSPVAAHFASINAGLPVHVADAADVDLTNVAAWHIDPDRRATGHRTTSLDFCQPELATIERMLASSPNAAIKLAPATEVPAHWTRDCELEWISRNRECRQLVAWHGALAQTPGEHRAAIVPSEHGGAIRSVSGTPNRSIPIVNNLDRYVFDIDPAVLAARLQGALAAEYDMRALDSGPTYLTGPQQIADVALACFEVTDVLPFEKRRLARHLREHSIGTLEIKKRGIDLDPDSLRRELKLRGDNAATVLVARVAGRLTAILAKRV